MEVAIQLEAEKRGKTVPTQDLRASIIVKYHTLGHLGTGNVFRKIWSADFWWPNMRQDIRQYCSTCLQCLKFDVRTQGFHPAKSMTADNVWDHIQVDLIGPIPMSDDGFQ